MTADYEFPPNERVIVSETSQTRFPNADCPACGRQIGPDDSIQSCLACETSYHQPCWAENGGCTKPECRRAARSKNIAATPPARSSVHRTVDSELAATQPVAAPPRPSPRSSNWTTAWLTAFGVLVLACVILTIIVGVTVSKRKAARRELTQLIESARSQNDPQVLADSLETYLNEPRKENLRELAEAELTQARSQIDDLDYKSALAPERGAHTDLSALEKSLQTYLDNHPDGARRLEISESLAQIPVRRDDRAFERAKSTAASTAGAFDLEENAWRTYLEEYPDGVHAAAARAEIERIPDKQEERRLLAVFARIDELVDADRLTDALLRLDQARGEVKSPARLDRIKERTLEIENQLAAIDAVPCLGDVPDAESLRLALEKRCSFYLLCYPQGPQREQVARQLHAVHTLTRDECLATLRTKLDEIDDDPAAALRALHEFRSHPLADEIDLSNEILQYHVQLLAKRIDDQLGAMQVITLTDGDVFIGSVSQVSPGWLQIKPRPIAGDTPKGRLVRSEEITTASPPLLSEMASLKQAVADLPLAKASDLIRAAMPAPDDASYKPERLAFLACLAGLDPADENTRDELAAADYAEHQGVYAPIHELADLDSGDARSPQLAALSFYEEFCRNAATEQVLQGFLANSFEHSFLGTTLQVPINWTLGPPRCSSLLLPGASEHFHAEFQCEYNPKATRAPGEQLPPSVESELDRELRLVSQTTRLTAMYEILAETRRLAGLGFDARRDGDTLIVNRVFPGSDAEAKGILPGDRVVFVENTLLSPDADNAALSLMIANSSGAAVELTFIRDGRRFRTTLERRGYTVEIYRMRQGISASGSLLNNSEPKIQPEEWIDVPAPS